MRNVRITTLVCVAAALTACPDDGSSGDGGSDGSGTETGTTGGMPDGSTSGTPSDSSGSTGAGPGSSTGTPTTGGSESTNGCLLGTEGCGCDMGMCEAGLACVDDVCTATTCGDGTVDRGEDCDDGNLDPGDGCEPDCTFTPGVAQVDLGVEHTCALLNRQAVRCWGRGTSGRLGYGNTNDIGDDEMPADAGDVQIGGAAVEIAVGGDFSCARLDDGGVRCWGFNGSGQLGLGHTAPVGDILLPRAFPEADLGGPAIDITAGTDHACAVLDGGDVVCWGNNNVGQLGYGNVADVGDDEDPVMAGTVAIGGLATQVAAGDSFTCALLDSGDVRCWGDGTAGRLGLGLGTTNIGDDELPDAVPTLDLGGPAVEIAAGNDHACARLMTNEVVCWGENNLGRLGYGNTLDIGDDELPVAAGVVSVGGAVATLGLGGSHTCAVTDMGEVRCWGEATNGRLGNVDPNNDVGDNELPSDVMPVDVGTTALSIEAGGQHTCAVLDGGDVRCWGRSNRGQLGYGNTVSIGDDEAPATVGPVVIE